MWLHNAHHNRRLLQVHSPCSPIVNIVMWFPVSWFKSRVGNMLGPIYNWDSWKWSFNGHSARVRSNRVRKYFPIQSYSGLRHVLWCFSTECCRISAKSGSSTDFMWINWKVAVFFSLENLHRMTASILTVGDQFRCWCWFNNITNTWNRTNYAFCWYK